MKPNIYKLEYSTKASAINALKTRGVLTEDGEYLTPYTEEIDGEIIEHKERTHAVVHLGNIVLTPATYDAEGNELTPAVISDKWHLDVMTDLVLDFGDKEVIIEEGQPSAHKFD